MSEIRFSQGTLEGVVEDIEELGKKRKPKQAGVTVIISKKDWRALLWRKIRILQVFFPSEKKALRGEFGIRQKEDSIRIKIIPA
jgi:hypothetical protein